MRVSLKQRAGRAAAALALSGGLAAMLALSSAGTAQAQSRDPNSKEPIKLGVLLPMTGPGALSGAGFMMAIRMSVKEMNDTGGLLGRHVELVLADDRLDPTQAVTEARRLTQQEHVNFVLGPLGSALAAAVAPIMTESSTLYFPSAVAPTPSPYSFSVAMSATSQATSMVQFMSQVLKVKTTAIIQDNGGACKALNEEYKRLLPQYGIALKGVQEVEFRAPDATPQLLALRRLDPEVLIQCSTVGEDAGLVIKNLDEIGWKVRFVSIAAAQATLNTLKAAGPDAFKSGRYYGLLPKAFTYCAGEKIGDRGYDRYLAKLKAFDPENFERIDQKSSLYMYDGIMLLRTAVETTRSLDATTLMNWIDQNGHTVRSVAGFPFAVTKTNHFMIGEDALTYVNHPDVVRPEDKFVQRDTGC
jgi:ABC-type branched-subunit amino acid transport system substrate-binding protein